MSNDDPFAPQRALATIKEITGTCQDMLEVVDAVLTLVKPESVFDWIETTRQQIAPMPIVQGVSKVFPHPGVVVPNLQTPRASWGANGSGAAATTSLQIFTLPVESKPRSTSQSGRRHVRRALANLVAFCRNRPGLAVLMMYVLYRARRLPGKALRVVDGTVNGVGVWLYARVLQKARKRVVQLVQWSGDRLTWGRFLSPFLGLTAGPEGVDPPAVEETVHLDVGDAFWVAVISLVALYLAYNRRKIWRRLT